MSEQPDLATIFDEFFGGDMALPVTPSALFSLV